MRLRSGIAGVLVVVAAAATIAGALLSRRGGAPGPGATPEQPEDPGRGQEIVAVGVTLEPTVEAERGRTITALAESGHRASKLAGITVDYPLGGSVFPPDIVAPTFLWHDASGNADRWLIDVAMKDGSSRIRVVAACGPPPKARIDPRCLGPTNKAYEPTEYQASAVSWRPTGSVWEAIKANAAGKPARVTVFGLGGDGADTVLSRGSVTLHVSADPVGAPIFYRDVPLMPNVGEKGVIKPLANALLPLIAWRLKDVSRDDSRVVLKDMPTCGNCHSFSADGKTLAMDVDGPSGDKGVYAIAPVARTTTIGTDQVITWNSFKDKPEGHKTIGFLSRISPDGRIALTTVNESVYVSNFTDFRFLQVFYPTRGILAWYSRDSRVMASLPGANDPDFVHCDPVWFPDGKSIVFARAKARDPYIEGRKKAAFPNDPAETPMQYDLYRMSFTEGRGGKPRAIEGASRNGMSNTFPKVSPDGKWIVFVKCRNGQLIRPDSRLWIVPAAGGEAREMKCNTSRMNSWHSFSPNGRWMVFSSKCNTPYTQMFLTHIDEEGNDSPPVLIAEATAANRAVNLPEFVNIAYKELVAIETPAIAYYRHFARGNELMEKRLFRDAVAEFEKALETEPGSYRINMNMGLCLLNLGRDDEGARAFRRAIETDPMNRAAYSSLGTVLGKQGKTREAVKCFKKALEIDPAYPYPYYNMANAYIVAGQLDRAIESLDAAAERKVELTGPMPQELRCTIGCALADQGKLDRAVEQVAIAVEKAPKAVSPRNLLGVLLMRQGKVGEAIEHFEAVLRLEPSNAEARHNLATARAHQKG